MKSIYIVEDEMLVRIGLVAMINERRDDYCVAGSSDNGLTAIDEILQLNPDIVLLDITIPGIDGLSVLQEIKKKDYKGFVMILTCHEEFHLVQKAIQYGANNYILKTDLDKNSIFSYLDDIKVSNQADSQEHSSKVNLNKDNFLCNLLLSGVNRPEEFNEACSTYGLNLQAKGIYLILMEIHQYSQVLKRYEREQQDMMFSAINDLLTESVMETRHFEIVRISPEKHGLILCLNTIPSLGKRRKVVETIVKHIRYNMETFMNIPISLGVSNEVSNITHISKKYNEVEFLFNRSYFFPKEVVSWQEQYSTDSDSQSLFNSFKNQLNKVCAGECNEPLEEIIQRLINGMYDQSTVIDKNQFLYEIREAFISLSQSLGIDGPEDINLWDVNDIIKYAKALDKLLQSNKTYGNHIVKQAVDFIHEHYREKIGLEDIAMNIGVSNNYLSRVFTKETGVNISNYITEKRITYAKYLLEKTVLKQYEIAEKCGLKTSAYFTYVFKKEVGLTPLQYRNGEHLQSNGDK